MFHKIPRTGVGGYLGDKLSPAELREIETEEDLERVTTSLNSENFPDEVTSSIVLL